MTDLEQRTSSTSDPVWLVVVSTHPAEADGREMLELVLAGASLDYPLAVIFTGPGLAYLEPDHFRAWQQLIDFDLAPVYLDDSDPCVLPPAGVRLADRSELLALYKNARGVMQL